MTETERQAEIMRREVKRQCLDCGEVHDHWIRDELLQGDEQWAWGKCPHCYSRRWRGSTLQNAPPLLQHGKRPVGVDRVIDAEGLEIDRTVAAVEG